MSTAVHELKGTVSARLEIGAFEALWSNGVSSFKQLRDRMALENAAFPSQLVDATTAEACFTRAVDLLRQAGVERFGVRIDGTADYPDKLHDAEYPLVLIYFQGLWDLAVSRGVAVVGTRKPSTAGIARTRKLVQSLVEKKMTIFSGLAAGIDTVAHTTAIKASGRTVAVLGTPLSQHYPKENAGLQREIARDHLVMSQVPVYRYTKNGPSFNRFYFPERNITMSAFSEATIIVEASETSGTLHQARAALKQGRELFILNNNFENPALTWPARFEQQGAHRVRELEDLARILGA